jgi:hypothetical protein
MGTKPAVASATHEQRDDSSDDAIRRIKAALNGLRYGAVTALVRDGVVVLVERTERFRLQRREHPA